MRNIKCRSYVNLVDYYADGLVLRTVYGNPTCTEYFYDEKDRTVTHKRNLRKNQPDIENFGSVTRIDLFMYSTSFPAIFWKLDVDRQSRDD